jgi:hypothetical protein
MVSSGKKFNERRITSRMEQHEPSKTIVLIPGTPRASRPRSPSMYLGIIPGRRGRLGRRRPGSSSSLPTTCAAGSTRISLRTSILIPGLILIRHRHRVLAFRVSRLGKINGDRQNGIAMRTIRVEGCREKLPLIQLVTCAAAGDLCRKKNFSVRYTKRAGGYDGARKQWETEGQRGEIKDCCLLDSDQQ